MGFCGYYKDFELTLSLMFFSPSKNQKMMYNKYETHHVSCCHTSHCSYPTEQWKIGFLGDITEILKCQKGPKWLACSAKVSWMLIRRWWCGDQIYKLIFFSRWWTGNKNVWHFCFCIIIFVNVFCFSFLRVWVLLFWFVFTSMKY